MSNEREKSPRRGLYSGVLATEAVTLGLSTPVMISVSDVHAGLACLIGLGLLALCIVAMGTLSRPIGAYLGWFIQVGAIALGFVVPTMFALGLIFGLLWVLAVILSNKIERERAAAWRAWDAQESTTPSAG